MGFLYSITGLFYDSACLTPWGGFFTKGIQGQPEDAIVGQLIDIYGPSEIKGTIAESQMRFLKSYANGREFDYNFSLKNGIWMGNFSSPLCRGRAVCKTNLCLENIDFE